MNVTKWMLISFPNARLKGKNRVLGQKLGTKLKLESPGAITTPYHSALCGFTQEPTKSDDRWHAGTVEEQERCQTLQTDGIGVVGKVMRSLSLDVQNEPSKEPRGWIKYCMLSCDSHTRIHLSLWEQKYFYGFCWLMHTTVDSLLWNKHGPYWLAGGGF